MSSTKYEPEIARDDIISHLQQVLTNRRFATAERNAKFLRYVVESTLEGKSDEIKETVIANEVYGRSSTYNPKVDSIVRVEASRLRQKLRSYYENEGQSSPIRFHLPNGSYIPVFERIEQPPAFPGVFNDFPLIADAPPRLRSIPLKRFTLAACLVLMGVLLVMQSIRRSAPLSPQTVEAVTAWHEGTALLQQDPHTGESENGPPKTLLRAIERLEFAVARDPKLAGAWATLAEAYDYVTMYVGRDPSEDGRRAEAAARRAIVLDPNLSAGHHMLGLALKGVKWDFSQAELAYRRALTLDPYNAYAAVEYADLLWETGRLDQAAKEIRKARALLPALPVLAEKEAEIFLDLGHPDAAIAAAKEAIEFKRTYLRAHVALGMAYEMKGDSQAALAEYQYVLQTNPSDRRALPAYGYLLAKTGQTARAREIAARLEKINLKVRNCSFQVAVVYAGLGEDKLALDWLETAWRTRQAHFPFAAVEYRFRGFHQNDRFKKLLDKAGLLHNLPLPSNQISKL